MRARTSSGLTSPPHSTAPSKLTTSLSPITASGRVRGRPGPTRGTQIEAISGPNIGESWAWPGGRPTGCMSVPGAHALGMNVLPGEAEAGERLKQTALRDFGPVPRDDERRRSTYKLTLSRHDAPVPSLLKYALKLIGLTAQGPHEKVAWWVEFRYRGERCELAHEKFGLRLYVRTNAPADEAQKTQVRIVKQLRSSVRTVEKLILDAAPELLGKGHATVVNQHRSLRRAYEYFRERAVDPVFIEDEHTTHEPVEGALGQAVWTFKGSTL
jgi:hypothetical protein